jgi:small conductance mechanosensitive channel
MFELLGGITVQRLLWALLLISLFFLLAWLIHRLSSRIAMRIIRLNRLAPEGYRWRSERVNTLHGLIADTVTFFAFFLATLLSLSLFVDSATLLWMVGLFSAGFGLSARPLVSDFLSGVSFIFEDTFEVGEKVDMMGTPGGNVEGIVEAVNLRTTLVRAPTGELFTVPNGEIRVVRNYSRGRFSTADVLISIQAEDLGRALPLLEELGKEAMDVLPNLLEPWRVISKSGEMGDKVELSLLAKARFGKAAELRTRLLALLQERLAEADIHPVG